MREKRKPATTLLLAATILGSLMFAVAAETPGEQKARIQRIEDALLAPCCYTEAVSHHQSEVAVKMRIQVAKWVAAGKSDQEILDIYVRQYGSRILVDPTTIPAWWTPWIPWLTLILGVGFGFWLLNRWRTKPASPPPGPEADLPDFDNEE